MPYPEPAEDTEHVDEPQKTDLNSVKHGHWIVFAGTAICSECKEKALSNSCGWPSVSTYCPHCGAKMDLEGGIKRFG